MKNLGILVLLLGAVACTSSSSEKPSRPDEWLGTWKAEWETPPESYPGIVDMEFYMDGQFVFSEDSLIVSNNGYPGCIFAIDTLTHSQIWEVRNDTLFTLNEPDSPGMSYKVLTYSENQIQLRLLDDIFVTLSR